MKDPEGTPKTRARAGGVGAGWSARTRGSLGVSPEPAFPGKRAKHISLFVPQVFIRNLLWASVPGLRGRVSAEQLGWKVDVKTKLRDLDVNLKPQVQVLLFPLNQEKLEEASLT